MSLIPKQRNKIIALLPPSPNTLSLGELGKNKAPEEEHTTSTVSQQRTTAMIFPPLIFIYFLGSSGNAVADKTEGRIPMQSQ